MNWHARYAHQAAWTHELRAYLFEKAGLSSGSRVLEVGCGTGAILGSPPLKDDLHTNRLHGLDHDLHALKECQQRAPGACVAGGDALALPYASKVFDISYCHFLLLWILEPLQALREMRRITVPSGYILAIAEPDYGARVDEPAELAELGRLQNAALQGQGAALRRGAELAELFTEAGIRLIETGLIQPPHLSEFSKDAWQSEWSVLESDLAASISPVEVRRFKKLDRQAWMHGERILNVPTYFACGQV